MNHFQFHFKFGLRVFFSAIAALLFLLAGARTAIAVTIELNSTGGTSATDGLHFYIDNTSKIQVRRLNNTGQVYSSTVTPPNNNLDNGVFLRANGTVYGASHTVGTGFTPTAYSTTSISATAPANPSSAGVQQSVINALGVTAGPQISIVWKYTTPLDFLTADVTLTIPVGYAVSAANPVRYYHVFDTFLGGSDKGCGVNVAGTPRIVGTYSSIAGACPTSTALPTSGTIIESFRERTGTFSSYCAALWSSFFTNGAPNCSVLQSAVLSNTITTTEIDTGIGIEYDFTAPGVYTFSYDFVIGTTTVPAYDHLEIQHDGAATLCPENVKVLACTSTTVPCPAGSVVNTGTLTGNLTVTPAAPAVSVTPTTFSIGPSVYTPTVVLQGTGAGTYTLGISGISGTVPLNGVKCSNGTIATTCSMVIANTPCVANYECLETSQPYNNLTSTPAARNPLYTKLAGTNFKFDVVALQSLGVQATTYTAAANIVVELFDDSVSPKPACNAYSAPVASQAITFVAGDLGRKTLPAFVNLPKAYSKLICRVKDSNLTPTIYGCSSDDFSVRPIAPVLSTTATALPAAANAAPIVKAGAAFTLGASTTLTDTYTGTLIQDTTKLTAQDTTSASQLSGGVVGNLYAAASTVNLALSTNGSPSNNASYSEVGYLYAAPGSFRDDSLTSVDLLPAGCAATNSCDCVTSTAANANLSDVLDASFRYGCSVGNKTAVSFGRFVPDHFAISSATLTNACTAVTPFTYFGQDFFTTAFTVTAQNLANITTKNYSNLFAKLVLTNYASYGFSAAPLPVGSVLPTPATAPTGVWPPSGATLGLATVIAKHQISRPTALTAQTSIVVSAAPAETEVPAVAATNLGTATMRYGRLRMQNAFGSESLDLPISVVAQYWNGSGWVQNVDDSCTPIVAPTSGSGLTFFPEVAATSKGNHLSAAETTSSVSGTNILVAGDAKFRLSKPGVGNNGYVDISFTAPAWLQFPWKSAVITSPTARATFGIYKNANEFIYLREIH